MTTQRIVVLGQMWPNGDTKAIKSLIEHIGDERPDRVIAAAGATEGFIQDLRVVYDGWFGAHLTPTRVCKEYGVEPLPELFEFGQGWASYSGEIEADRLPHTAAVRIARKLNISIVSGEPPRFQCNSFSITNRSGEPLRTNAGISVGHLRGDLSPRSSDLGFAVLTLAGSRGEGRFNRFQNGRLKTSTWGPVISLPTDIEVDPRVWQRAFDAILRRT